MFPRLFVSRFRKHLLLAGGQTKQGCLKNIPVSFFEFLQFTLATFLLVFNFLVCFKLQSKTKHYNLHHVSILLFLAELKTLRNQTTGAYYLLNSLWLILNFALQLTITDIAIVFTIAGTVLSVSY